MKPVVIALGIGLTACLGAGGAGAWTLSGTSRTTLRASWADAAPDQDDRGAYGSQLLVLDAEGLPADGRAFFSGAFRWDLGQEEPDSVFYSSVDRFPGGSHLFVYDLGVVSRPLRALELTAGRFSWESAEPVHLDGAGARVRLPLPVEASVEAFGGRLVQYYEDLERDAAWGAAAEARLPWGSRLRADYLDYFDDLLRLTVDGIPQPRVNPTICVVGTKDRQVWVYVDNVILDRVYQDSGGNLLFTLPGVVQRPRLIEVILRNRES